LAGDVVEDVVEGWRGVQVVGMTRAPPKVQQAVARMRRYWWRVARSLPKVAEVAQNLLKVLQKS
jgi:hypothetical protein